ncbi:Coiled-coil domain-containing protein 27 [Acipenser ruthenus]|uniref:Coiled-coil domain-containing protein 27 n=1 Tax=Acipenser ruthenus TaxID=7906 RepID=A0A444UTU4_ACIRT|nr:Coiled-coil domain-containing protein 27 [Acipenser ruthenus]
MEPQESDVQYSRWNETCQDEVNINVSSTSTLQGLGELPNDNSLDRGSSRESEQNKPSTAPRSLQNRPAGNCPWYIALLHEKEQCLLMLGDEINRLSVFEFEAARKDQMIAVLQEKVAGLRRDLSFREADLLKAGSDQDRLQRELTERVAQLHAMSSKQIAELQREESKRNELLAGFKVKIQNLQQELAAERASLAQLQKDRTEIQNKAAALQQSEHQTKVALEQLQSRFERFRGKIIQAAYLAPGAKLLVTEVSDNEILSTMQKIVNDQFHQMLIQKGEKVPNLYITETSEKQAKPKSPSKKS